MCILYKFIINQYLGRYWMFQTATLKTTHRNVCFKILTDFRPLTLDLTLKSHQQMYFPAARKFILKVGAMNWPTLTQHPVQFCCCRYFLHTYSFREMKRRKNPPEKQLASFLSMCHAWSHAQSVFPFSLIVLTKWRARLFHGNDDETVHSKKFPRWTYVGQQRMVQTFLQVFLDIPVGLAQPKYTQLAELDVGGDDDELASASSIVQLEQKCVIMGDSRQSDWRSFIYYLCTAKWLREVMRCQPYVNLPLCRFYEIFCSFFQLSFH